MRSGLFKENGIEKFEEFIYSVPPGKRADCLKAFVDRVGILQAELPTEEYEHNLLLEINSQLKKPFPDAVILFTELLLDSDRDERMSGNLVRILARAHEKEMSRARGSSATPGDSALNG